MPELGYLAAFLVGLLGGTHCIGMCGGIVGALTIKQPGSTARDSALHLAYNLGRIACYGASGAVMGAIGSMGLLMGQWLPMQLILYVLANLMLIALGAYLAGFSRVLIAVESLGQRFWARIQPWTRRFLPARTPGQALILGAMWGFLPCGMVYSMLATALVSGGATAGGLLLLMFGLGTLPNLLLAGWVLRRAKGVVHHRVVRLVAGLIVIGFGVAGLGNALFLATKAG